MLEQLSDRLSLQNLELILILVALETVLSADNAVALAALVQDLKNPTQQRQALNLGLVGAFGLRIALLFAASWTIQFWQVELAGAIYLLWLAGKHFIQKLSIDETDEPQKSQMRSFWYVIALIAVTDLAFSLDSITTAIALSDRFWVILTGAILGVLALRFLSGLFVKWLVEFPYLQDAAYLTVLGVGLKLLFKALLPNYLLPEWIGLMMVALLFIWGFSKRSIPELD